jgi:potassium-transporting ATPase KdpC subunit
MKNLLRPAATLLLLFSLLLGLAYPAVMTAAAALLFPDQAQGSLLRRGDRIVGSALVGQTFHDPGHSWGRPSATAPNPYDGAASTGSNLGPTNPALRQAVRERIAALRAADPGNDAPVPVDLVTTSASGLDPDISPAAAYYQVGRVARTRGLPEVEIRRLVEAHVRDRTWGVLGEPRVNVLELNLALDEASPEAPRRP